MRRLLALLVAVTAVLAFAATVTAGTWGSRAKPPSLQFLGQAIVPTGATFAGTTIGGLSSITYDARRGDFYVLSDDQGQFNPSRFYTVRLDLADGHLGGGDVHFTGVTTLLAPDGHPYAPFSLDPEGLTLAKHAELIVTSEGIANQGIAAWVRRYALDGTFRGDLPVPDAFRPTSPTHGVRQNLAFEAAAVALDGRHLFVGMEGALAQDGPAATLTNGSASRILRYNLASGRLDRQFVYFTDPIAQAPVPPTQFAVSGLVELLPFNDEFMLSMERSFSVGVPGTGNTIKLYFDAFPGAEDVNGADSIAGELGSIRPVRKTLLVNLDTLGIPLDNVEGMTLGPTLPDGRQSLVLVSDNNFAASQFTQFLLFALN
ncbi:MAG: esterase-like activity of phytase family protein [Actinomycetota bacterium]